MRSLVSGACACGREKIRRQFRKLRRNTNRGFTLRWNFADVRVQCVRWLMISNESKFRLSVERCGCDPVIDPRLLVGLFQQRLWGTRNPPTEDVISNYTQQDSQEQSGSDAKSGGDSESHCAPIPLSNSAKETAIESNILESSPGFHVPMLSTSKDLNRPPGPFQVNERLGLEATVENKPTIEQPSNSAPKRQ